MEEGLQQQLYAHQTTSAVRLGEFLHTLCNWNTSNGNCTDAVTNFHPVGWSFFKNLMHHMTYVWHTSLTNMRLPMRSTISAERALWGHSLDACQLHLCLIGRWRLHLPFRFWSKIL